METEAELKALVEQVEKMVPSGRPSGHMGWAISEDGFYEEAGLRFSDDDYLLGQLYAGLTVLALDMHRYLEQRPREDAAVFAALVSLVHAEEASVHGGGRAFPNFAGLPTEGLPTGLASAAALGRPTVAPLADPGIVHEWTFKPGKRLFVRLLHPDAGGAAVGKFGRELKETVCGKDGPYQLLKRNLLGQAALPAMIAGNILAVGFAAATFWQPLAVYLAILLVKTGLSTYCGPDRKAKSRRAGR
jgi:hypothetical protein